MMPRFLRSGPRRGPPAPRNVSSCLAPRISVALGIGWDYALTFFLGYNTVEISRHRKLRHGCTRINTDGGNLTSSYPCSSVFICGLISRSEAAAAGQSSAQDIGARALEGWAGVA